MTLRTVIEQLGLNPCGSVDPDREVTGAYAGDLLSDVMAHSQPGHLWLTIQVHVNIVAVAVLREHAAILVVNGREPAPETLTRAAEEKLVILTSPLPAFELCGRLHALGIGGGT